MRLFSTAVAAFTALIWASSSIAAPGQTPPLTPKVSPTISQPAATPAPPPAGAGRALTAPDLESWLDGYLPYALQRGDIAGAVVVVVKDGQVLLEKGYGYSDVAKKAPVNPQTTLFRPGSTSKLFTWTAVMQQVEQGKIDLDADINTYLDFKIPPHAGGRPITMRDLMTHTGGFEESLKDLITVDAREATPLDKVVKRWVPARIFPAGTTPAYSNYATALAGYIVQRTSGVPYETYIQRNIFGPLGMQNSTFHQPLTGAMAANLSKGYKLGSGAPVPYETVDLAPAGSLSATGADMARFMIAHLQNGAFGASRILRPETAQMMHSGGYTIMPPLNKVALGFYENNTNGRRVIAHGGDTLAFHSDLHLFLDDGVGVFISLNSTGKEGAAVVIREELFRSFADRYFPGPDYTGQVDPKLSAEHARMVAGAYRASRRAETSLFAFSGLLTEAKVVINPDGTISLTALRGLNGLPKKYREISPFVWVDEAGKNRLAARVENGKINYFQIDNYPFQGWQRTPAAKSAAVLVPAMSAALAALLLTVILWPVTAIVRRRYGHTFKLEGQEARAHRLVRIGAAASAIMTIAWGFSIVTMLSNPPLMAPALDWWIWTLHIVGTLSVFAGAGLALWNAWLVWRGQRGWFAKLWSLVLVLSTLLLLWVAIAFHLVGLGASY
jgi:CubicO group peptidase (beta-lactamase class C family)